MAKVRQDAWSHEDDLLLAETVLRHVRDGSTQLNAFEEVGDELNRTSAACGFRWNAEVRKNYVQAMETAKRQRKEKKRALQSAQQQQAKHVHKTHAPIYQPVQPQVDGLAEETISLENIIHQLQQLLIKEQQTAHSTYEFQKIERENEELKEHVFELEKQAKQTEQQFLTMKEDYESFVQIMERARKMTVFDDQQHMKAPAFKMDKNGNLEQLVERLN